MQTWLAVADVLGLPPMWSTSEIPYATVLPRLAEGGGWRPTGVAKNMLLLDRAAHPVPTLRHVQRPNERAVLRVVSTLTDRDHERRELGDAIERERERAPDDRRISGALVVVRHGSNTRIAGRAHGRSDGLWIRALRDPAAAMPVRTGWVWLAPRGTHLLPGA